MNPHQFVKVFDIRDTSLLDWTSSTGLILVPIGIAIVVIPAIFPEILTLKDIPFLRIQALQSSLFRYGFASFAILMNFPRFNKMKGMGQIVSWSVRDESLHTQSIIELFHDFIEENREIWTPELQREIYKACETIVTHEDAFIDLAFEQGAVEGLTAREVKEYIRYIADRRLMQLGLNQLYHVSRNPLPWLDDMLNAVEHTNFFENRATEYSKASTTGTWEDAFADPTLAEAAAAGA